MSDYGALPERYPTVEQRLAEQEQRELEKEAQREAEAELVHTSKLAAADAFGEAHHLVALVKQMREEGHIKDPALAARTAKDLVITAGVMIDKGLVLEGRPTHIHQTNAQDLWASVWRKLGAVESTATEIDETFERDSVGGGDDPQRAIPTGRAAHPNVEGAPSLPGAPDTSG